MTEFLKDSQIITAIEELIGDSFSYLWLVSPYIKLHDKVKDKLKLAVRNNPLLRVVVIFGKNEEDITKSIAKEDIEFLKEFPNVIIAHEKRLHAKYYANEVSCVITSMNLHQFSQNNNIEVGVKVSSSTVIGGLRNSAIENRAQEYFEDILQNAVILFERRAIEKKNLIGISSGYSHSETVSDEISNFFFKEHSMGYSPRKQAATHTVPPVKQNSNPAHVGFCIRTGVPISFNPERPLSYEAFKMWSQYQNRDYPEKFCHYSGELSNGETSVSKPILRKNWTKAKEIQSF